MRSLIVLCTLVGAAALAGAAGGGGWASVGFEPLPDGTEAGATWKARILVKQHGVTPLGGLRPVVTIEQAESGRSEQFLADEAVEVGVYEAAVVFPSAGDWRLAIDSGFGDSRVTYGPFGIAPTGVADDPGMTYGPVAGLAAALGVLALLGVSALGVRRLRRAIPASR